MDREAWWATVHGVGQGWALSLTHSQLWGPKEKNWSFSNTKDQTWGTCLLNIQVRNEMLGASQVAQWYRVHLPMQRTHVWSLIQEDPTSCGATKPVQVPQLCAMLWSLGTSTREPTLHSYQALCTLEPLFHIRRSQHQEKPMHRN